MTPGKQNFDEAVWRVVSAIAAGRVMSYGEVARAAGYPRHARLVSKAMSRSPLKLPWYRVLRADRSLAFAVGSDSYNRQRALLEKEGVRFVKGKAVVLRSDDDNDLDETIWGLD